MEIHPAGGELFFMDMQTDGRTDVTKLIFAFWNFANAPKKRASVGLLFLNLWVEQ